MSQAKTQMVNKSFGLNNNTSSAVDSVDNTINGWSNDGLGQFGRSGSNNTSDNNIMNWTNPAQANKLIPNSSNSSSSDLWSNDISNHNNFNHNLEDFLKNDKNKISSNINSQNQNHSQFLKQQQHQQNNKWNDNLSNNSFSHSNSHTTANSSLNFNDSASCNQQHLPRASSNNQFLTSISNSGQSDLNNGNNSSTWNPFSTSSIIANSNGNNDNQLHPQSQLPNRPSSSASTVSSTNTAADNNSNSNNTNSHNRFNHSHAQNHKAANMAQWSNQQQGQQSGWMDSDSNEWQQQQSNANSQQSNLNTASSSTTHSSSNNMNSTNIVRGGSATTNNTNSGSNSSANPPPIAPVPPPPSSSSTSSSQAAAASSAKSWAKIVSQQSSPSTNPATATATTNSNNNSSAIPANQSQSQVTSSNSTPASSSSQNSFTNNNNNNGNGFNKGQVGTKPNELTQAEWNIKVNQQVPWEMDQSNRSSNNNNNSGANSLNSSTNQFSNSNGNNNSNGMLQQQANQKQTNSNCSSSASSSSSSGTNGLIIQQQNDVLIANLMNAKNGSFIGNQQQQLGQGQLQQQKSQIDTGTDIWLSNKSKPNGPVSNWDSGNVQASNTSSNSQSSSSSPTTTLQSNNPNWSNNNNNGAQWNANNSGNNMRWNNNQENNSQWNQQGQQPSGNSQSWSGNQESSKQGQQIGGPTSSGSSVSSSSSQQPLSESTNQLNRWNQQQQQATPPPSITPVAATTTGGNVAAMDLASQAAALKVNIEPQGWDDPDFKIAKKSDDGTNIWGDPENHRQVKVTKWMHVTRHMSSQQQQQHANNKPNVDQENLINSMQQQQQQSQQMSNSQSFNSGVGNTNNGNVSGNENQTSSSPTLASSGAGSQWNQSGSGTSNGNNQHKMLQQQISGSSWSNTPAAPLNLQCSESLNNNESPIGSNVNEWTQDLVDTKSWSTFKDQAKNNFDPSVGIVDTSKWNGQGPQPGTINGFGQTTGLQQNHQQQQNDMMKSQSMSRSSTNPLGGLNSSNMMNSVVRMPFTAQQQQAQKSNLNLNLMQAGQSMPQSINSPQSLMGSVNANSNLNNMILNNASNGNSNNNNNSANNLNPSPQPQIQNQLIESFRLAVSSGIIHADLLNTKLPQEMLTMLYQLFQTLSSYIASQNKINELNKRRVNLIPAQFKSESELLNLEAQNLKTTLVSLQTKINSAHQIIKQANLNANNSNNNQKQSNSPSLGNTPPINSVELAAAAAGVQLNDLPILKDHSNSSSAMSSQLNAQQQRSKLLQLLNDNDPLGKNGMNLNRQTSYQPTCASGNNNKLQSQFSQPSPFNNISNQWSNFDANSLMGMGNGPIVDDRITPFIPGQLWAGSQSSIEDDPNCTPGSVSKSLLSETIDPESILSGLQRNSHWSNFSDNLLNSNMGMIGINSQNRNPMQRGNNPLNNNSQNWGGLGSQASMNSGSIGEQLWGVGSRSNSRAGNPVSMQNASNAMNNNNRQSGNNNAGNNFNSNNQMMNQQQQQFFSRNGVNGNGNGNNSNQWNANQMGGNQNGNNMNDLRQQQSNSQNNQFGNNSNVNSGNFILIRNVSAQVDQTTLRALCSQHASGQLTYYRYIPQMTCVIVRYNTKEEANNAQNKLNSVSLGNTQIFTQPLNDNDLKFLFSM